MRRDININSILPVEAKIFYEDNVPYLWYKGKVDSNGKEWFITFPKINLEMESASIISEVNFWKSNTLECTFKPSFFVGDEEIFQVEENLNGEKEDKNLFNF